MARLSDQDLTRREYRTMDRLSQRRLDRTGWLRGEDVRLLALQTLAAVGPSRVLDAGCGTGDFAALIAAPDVLCVDSSEAAIDRGRRPGALREFPLRLPPDRSRGLPVRSDHRPWRDPEAEEGASKEYRAAHGDTPLSIKDDKPWHRRRLVVGTGAQST